MKKGTLNSSVVHLGLGKLHKSMFHYACDANVAANMKNNNAEKMLRLKRAGYKRYDSHPTERGAGRGKPGLTIMPAELVLYFIRFYTIQSGQVYLDPFMGQGVQMQVAKLCGLDYYGYDISHEFFTYVSAVKHKIDDKKTVLDITCGDSRYPENIPDGIGDFSFHSPPYWDIEYYGSELGQLGLNQTYPEFLDSMFTIAKSWLPKFKPGGVQVVNVNDFRKNGKFYPYHADTIALYIKAGWVLHDIFIIAGLTGKLPQAFSVDFNMKHIAPKIHEYALVFIRP